ncbi:MAG TPA: STAS domain-containing protein [Bacteroidia bacterium]|nr:STAS domain-containing protein [Bacteroidia bacterium]HNT80981.1 STAS domain-containing protein [Bacteroidia bacterium]
MEYNYRIEKRESHNIIYLTGNLIELNQSKELLDEVTALIANNSINFVLNLQEFKYMNSTGLSVLISILTKARKAGGEAVICNVPENIKSLLSITKLNNVFSVAESESQAEAALV